MYSTRNISDFNDKLMLTAKISKGVFLSIGLFLVSGSAAMALPIPSNPITNTTLVNGTCGYANGGSYYQSPWAVFGATSAATCLTGALASDSGTGPWNWTCIGRNGGATASCSAILKQDGICGPNSNTPFTTAPDSGLCSLGSPSSVSGSTEAWNWSCSGVNGGQTTQCAGFIQQSQGFVVPSGSYVSQAAQVEQPLLCSNTENYPAQWLWDQSKITPQPRAATAADNLTPRIDHVRNGVVIASYSSFGSNVTTCPQSAQSDASFNPAPAAARGCGPFGGNGSYRFWQNGDTFLVYPAVYSGLANTIFIAPEVDHYQGPLNVPNNITIQGVTVNGIRPVILDPAAYGWDFAGNQAPIYIFNAADTTGASNSTNIVIENLDLVMDQNTGFWGMSGIYINGGTNVTLRQMRILGFENVNANGIFVTPNNIGTITLDQIELGFNGNWNGPRHNAYINGSILDPNFTVHMLNSWSHDAFYGHLFKSRAQITIMEGNYFQGGLPQPGYGQAENWLLDVPNGGQLTARNNVFVKNASGPNSNGAAITFAVEGVTDGRTQSVDIENNTFVALANAYDGWHPIWPMFFWGYVIPGTSGYQIPAYPSGSGYIVPSTTVTNNAFVGYCPNSNNAFMNYRGTVSSTAAFSELNPDFSFANPASSTDISQAGTPAYAHEAQTGLTRQVINGGGLQYLPIGAEDD